MIIEINESGSGKVVFTNANGSGPELWKMLDQAGLNVNVFLFDVEKMHDSIIFSDTTIKRWIKVAPSE